MTTYDPAGGADAPKMHVEEMMCRSRRPFVTPNLLFWNTTHTTTNDSRVAGSDVPPRGMDIQVTTPTSMATPVMAKKARHRVNSAPTEIIDTGDIAAWRPADATGDTAGITQIAWSPTLAQRYRHSGSHYQKEYRKSNTVAKLLLAAFVAVSWPLYIVIVYLIHTR